MAATAIRVSVILAQQIPKPAAPATRVVAAQEARATDSPTARPRPLLSDTAAAAVALVATRAATTAHPVVVALRQASRTSLTGMVAPVVQALVVVPVVRVAQAFQALLQVPVAQDLLRMAQEVLVVRTVEIMVRQEKQVSLSLRSILIHPQV
jgi:hypothetical protein